MSTPIDCPTCDGTGVLQDARHGRMAGETTTANCVSCYGRGTLPPIEEDMVFQSKYGHIGRLGGPRE